MSICVYGRIKRRCINEDLLEGFLADFFSLKSNIIREKDGNSVTYEGLSSQNEVTISFISEKKPPYNVYDSNIIGDEYEYVQLILFDIKKEEASIDKYKKIIEFFIYLKEKINSDILVTSDVHNEICLLEENEIIWSKNVLFV